MPLLTARRCRQRAPGVSSYPKYNSRGRCCYPHFTGFRSESDTEDAPRERPEDRTPQEAPSQAGSPDERPAQAQHHAAAGRQGRKQSPQGTQDDAPGQGEVSRLPQARPGPWPPQDPATHLFPRLERASSLDSHGGNAWRERPPRLQLKVTAPVLLATSFHSERPPAPHVWEWLQTQRGPHPAPEDASLKCREGSGHRAHLRAPGLRPGPSAQVCVQGGWLQRVH